MTELAGGQREPGHSRAVRSIGAISRSVLRRAKHAQYARAICGALGAFTLTIACALERGSRLGDAEVLILAALLSLAAFASWVRSERIEARTVLERIDERLHLSGAFLSAHESCEKTPDAPLTQLGAAKLLQRVRSSQALEAAVPHTLGFVALPLLGLLVLVQTVQVRDARQSEASLVTVEVGTVADHLEDIERMNRASLTEMQRRELAEIQRAAEVAAEDAAQQFLDQTPADQSQKVGGQDDWREQLRSVADDLDQLASEARPGSEFAEQLADAAAQAEALAMDSEPQEASPAEAEAGSGRFAGSEEGTGGGDSSFDMGSAMGPGEESGGPEVNDPGGLGSAEVDPSLSAPELAGSNAAQGPDGGAAKGEGAAANGELLQGTAPLSAGDGERSKVGVLRPIQEGAERATSRSDESDPDGALDARVPDEAEELLDRSQWWLDRDDAIVRAWLAKRAPK